MEKFINIRGQLVPVSDEIYYTFYSMRRRDSRNGVVYYDAYQGWKDSFINPALSIEDELINAELLHNLNRSLSLLDQSDYHLIKQLYYDRLTIAELSRRSGVPQRTIGCRRDRILKQLRQALLDEATQPKQLTQNTVGAQTA